MSGSDLYHSYHEGLAAASQVDAVNPYAPAPEGSARALLARMWLRGRLKYALDDDTK
ncbi:hypothetical protein [Nocardia acidivorans]|uniref:hypothetical protein n=1 Tax=Nocardia acidivorans TaxID=404580 RepID=UPI000AC7D972|nr:hypothetical protein [Nocardia acidivorans]